MLGKAGDRHRAPRGLASGRTEPPPRMKRAGREVDKGTRTHGPREAFLSECFLTHKGVGTEKERPEVSKKSLKQLLREWERDELT